MQAAADGGGADRKGKRLLTWRNGTQRTRQLPNLITHLNDESSNTRKHENRNPDQPPAMDRSPRPALPLPPPRPAAHSHGPDLITPPLPIFVIPPASEPPSTSQPPMLSCCRSHEHAWGMLADPMHAQILAYHHDHQHRLCLCCCQSIVQSRAEALCLTAKSRYCVRVRALMSGSFKYRRD